jgi:hypothetical protein
MASNPLPPEEQPPQPPARDAERPADDDWRPYRPTPWPAPVPPATTTPSPGHHIPQRDDRAPYPAPTPALPPQPPYGAGFGPAAGQAPPPPSAFAPPVTGPQPPPPAFAPPIAGPQPPPPAPGLLPPQFEPQFERRYEPRYGPPPPGGADEVPPRPRRRKRRLIEFGALLILLPGVLGVRWYDDSNLAVTRDPHQRVTVVPSGAWAKLGSNQWRMLGRPDPNSTSSGGGGSLSGESPPGSAQLILLLEVKVLAAQGAKDLGKMQYEIRDREGHVWSADGAVQNQSIDDEDPAPGSTQRVRVTATVPRGKVSSVVLDLHIQPFDRPEREVLEVLRFAH